MLTKKQTKRVLIYAGITLLALWFGGNLAAYRYLKQEMIKFENTARINVHAEKLQLSEPNSEGEWLPFVNCQLKLPYYKEDIEKILPVYSNHRLVAIAIALKRGPASFVACFPMSSSQASDLKERYGLRGGRVSWWNLIRNIKKVMAISTMKLPKLYDIETAYLKGALFEACREDNFRGEFIWWAVDGKFTMLGFSGKNEMANESRSIIASMRPLENVDESYKAVDTLYKQKASKYPEELLLVSMISLKGSNLENLQELLNIMETKNYESGDIRAVKAEIEFLRTKGKN